MTKGDIGIFHLLYFELKGGSHHRPLVISVFTLHPITVYCYQVFPWTHYGGVLLPTNRLTSCCWLTFMTSHPNLHGLVRIFWHNFNDMNELKSEWGSCIYAWPLANGVGGQVVMILNLETLYKTFGQSTHWGSSI